MENAIREDCELERLFGNAGFIEGHAVKAGAFDLSIISQLSIISISILSWDDIIDLGVVEWNCETANCC
jgi:hypothetical protein